MAREWKRVSEDGCKGRWSLCATSRFSMSAFSGEWCAGGGEELDVSECHADKGRQPAPPRASLTNEHDHVVCVCVVKVGRHRLDLLAIRCCCCGRVRSGDRCSAWSRACRCTSRSSSGTLLQLRRSRRGSRRCRRSLRTAAAARALRPVRARARHSRGVPIPCRGGRCACGCRRTDAALIESRLRTPSGRTSSERRRDRTGMDGHGARAFLRPAAASVPSNAAINASLGVALYSTSAEAAPAAEATTATAAAARRAPSARVAPDARAVLHPRPSAGHSLDQATRCADPRRSQR